MHALVEFGIHQPLARAEPAAHARIQRALVHARGKLLCLLSAQVRIVRPFHELVPHLRVAAHVHIDLVEDEGAAFERRHGAEQIARAVEHAHAAFVVHVLGRFLVEPHEIQRSALKLFPALIATFEADHRNAAEHVAHADLIDDARRRAFFAREHDHVFDPGGVEVVQDLFLRHVALHLLGKRDHPAEHVGAVFAVRVDAARHVHALDRAALRFAAAVAAEHPAVALAAAVKGDLLSVFLLSRIVAREVVSRRAPRLFALDGENGADDFLFTHMTKSVIILPLFSLRARKYRL